MTTNQMKIRTRNTEYPGFGVALETWSMTTGKWYHTKWIAGPAYLAQKA